MTGLSFIIDVHHVVNILKKNMYPSHLIDKVISWSASGKLVPGGVDTSSNQDRSNTF